MKSHRGPPQSSPAQMKIPSGCGFLLLKTATLLLLFTHRFSRGATLQICTKKSSRRSSPARLVELFPHLEGTNTNSVRLFQLSARPHSLSRFGVLPREKVCIGFALNVPEKKKKKKENGSPFFPSPAGRNFLRTRVQKCKQKLWTVQRATPRFEARTPTLTDTCSVEIKDVTRASSSSPPPCRDLAKQTKQKEGCCFALLSQPVTTSICAVLYRASVCLCHYGGRLNGLRERVLLFKLENKIGVEGEGETASLRRVTSIGCPLLLADSGASWDGAREEGVKMPFSRNMFEEDPSLKLCLTPICSFNNVQFVFTAFISRRQS